MLIPILKFLSIVSTAIFGIYASVVNYKDENGKITKESKIALYGVLISAIIGGSLQIYSDSIADKKSEILIEKNNIILSDIQRAINPLNKLDVAHSLYMNIDSAPLTSYYDSMKNFNSSWRYKDNRIREFNLELEKNDADWDYTTINDKDLYKNFQIMDGWLGTINLNLYFFKDLISVDSFLNSNEQMYKEDINIKYPLPQVSYSLIPTDKLIHNNAIFLYEELTIESNSDNWNGNSNIVSTYDLLKGQLVIIFEMLNTSNQSLNGISLYQLNLGLPNGINLHFDDQNLKEVSNERNMLIYTFAFPSQIDELLLLTQLK